MPHLQQGSRRPSTSWDPSGAALPCAGSSERSRDHSDIVRRLRSFSLEEWGSSEVRTCELANRISEGPSSSYVHRTYDCRSRRWGLRPFSDFEASVLIKSHAAPGTFSHRPMTSSNARTIQSSSSSEMHS